MARFAIPVAAARKSRPVSEDDSDSDTSYSSEDSFNNGHPTTATLHDQSHSNSVRSEHRTEMLDWTLQLIAAERRTPTRVTSLFRDKWTAVANSTVVCLLCERYLQALLYMCTLE